MQHLGNHCCQLGCSHTQRAVLLYVWTVQLTIVVSKMLHWVTRCIKSFVWPSHNADKRPFLDGLNNLPCTQPQTIVHSCRKFSTVVGFQHLLIPVSLSATTIVPCFQDSMQGNHLWADHAVFSLRPLSALSSSVSSVEKVTVCEHFFCSQHGFRQMDGLNRCVNKVLTDLHSLNKSFPAQLVFCVLQTIPVIVFNTLSVLLREALRISALFCQNVLAE